MCTSIIHKMRAFNRFYMTSMNLLGNHYLGSEYSATEARILFEIYEKEGCNAAYLAKIMNLDKSYLSRIIIEHEKNGRLQRIPSCADRRSYDIFLTDKGKQITEEFIRRSDDEIGKILIHLSEKNKLRLADALDTIIEILSDTKGGTRNESSSL